MLYRFVNSNWWQIPTILVLLLLAIILCLSGCGTSSDRQTKTVEVEKYQTGQLAIDTPIGQFVVQPTQFQRLRTEDETEQKRTALDMPEVPALVAAASGGTPWGIIAGLGGAAIAAFMGKKAIDAGRQRNELIDGVELAKSAIDPQAWDKAKVAMAAAHSVDTQRAVWERTP